MKYIEYYVEYGWNGAAAELLLSNGAEQKKIKAWCKKNPRNDWAVRNDLAEKHSVSPNKPESLSSCEGWEATLRELAEIFGSFSELYEWEVASSEQRTAHITKVAKLARDLAETLTERPHPWYPPVMALLEDDCVMDVFNLLPKNDREKLLLFNDNDHRKALRLFFPQSGQRLPSVLKRLADHAESKLNEKKRIARPNTGHANSRAFALHMAERIGRHFEKIPNEIIAACVSLKYPDLENPPNADTIRDWRGAK